MEFEFLQNDEFIKELGIRNNIARRIEGKNPLPLERYKDIIDKKISWCKTSMVYGFYDIIDKGIRIRLFKGFNKSEIIETINRESIHHVLDELEGRKADYQFDNINEKLGL